MSDATDILSRQDRDAVAEITTVTMGAAASTLGMLIGQEIEIAPDTINTYASIADLPDLLAGNAGALTELHYTKGLNEQFFLLLGAGDARHLASLMLGEEAPAVDLVSPLDDASLGAMSELMNQMMNAASTALASLIHETVEIGNPSVTNFDLTTLVPVLTQEIAVNHLLLTIPGQAPIPLYEIRGVPPIQALVEMVENATMRAMEVAAAAQKAEEAAAAAVAAAVSAAPPAPVAPPPQAAPAGAAQEAVTVRPVQFSAFEQQNAGFSDENRNLELVMDVTLSLSVELGKTTLSIKEVLEMTRGSVVELERVAGEPVDLLANGKLIARGEVVVIEDNFGLRITSIVSPAERLRGL